MKLSSLQEPRLPPHSRIPPGRSPAEDSPSPKLPPPVLRGYAALRLPDLRYSLQAIAEAVLIGLLFGIQREGFRSQDEPPHAEARDFVLIASAGAISGLLGNPWLGLVSLAAITGLLAVHNSKLPGPPRFTSDMTVVVVFCLGFLTAAPGFPNWAVVAIASTIMLVALLEAKQRLHRLIRHDLTEIEFAATLRFLTLIFIIYPLLPDGRYGPYEFFAPKTVWLFVILVSSISYTGYFLEKFIGGESGITLAGLVGGLASTTAATLSFARRAAEQQAELGLCWYATVVANTVQIPRLFAILWVVNRDLAAAIAAPMAVIAAAGALLAWFLSRRVWTTASEGHRVPLGNPFSLTPTLKFAVLFSSILLVTKAAAARQGSQGLVVSSVLGGAFDVDAVAVSLAELLRAGIALPAAAATGVLVAIAANAVLKTVLAFTAAGPALALRVAGAFLWMYLPGAVTMLLMPAQ